jgi:2-oxoisovalerate dehydrogenase E2 component (dihydrolipoyl transacylase)
VADFIVKLPDVGEGIAQAEIVEWHINVGDTISEDQAMVDVMTDKATVELPSPYSGTVVWLGAAAGDIVAVGAPIIRIEANGADAVEPIDSDSVPAVQPTAPPQPVARPTMPDASTLAAPAVRQRARQLGIDLVDVAGTGPDGRVIHTDLDAGLRGPATPMRHGIAMAEDTVEEVRVIGLRRNIAQRMEVAKRHIPHFTYVEEVDVTATERLRNDLNEQHADSPTKLSVLPFLMRAVVVALREFPQMNARHDDDNGIVRRHRAVHLGIATQTAKGLMVPVVKHAEGRDIWESAAEVARLATAARSNTITLAELGGSTITISSLGALGGFVSTPIINYPEVAIVGINKIVTRPIYVDGVIVPRQIMNLSSSFDHRVIDGADAAGFIQRVKHLLETPALLFV